VSETRSSFARWDDELRNRTWQFRMRAELAIEESRAIRRRTAQLVAKWQALLDPHSR
jgi:hypothetical protein